MDADGLSQFPRPAGPGLPACLNLTRRIVVFSEVQLLLGIPRSELTDAGSLEVGTILCCVPAGHSVLPLLLYSLKSLSACVPCPRYKCSPGN